MQDFSFKDLWRVGSRVVVTRATGRTTHGGVGIVLNPRGEVLLTLARYRRGWSFPGGWMESGETPIEAIRRELSEEVAYPRDAPLRMVHSSKRAHHIEHFGFAEVSQDVADRLHCDSWELRAVRWCSPHSMPRLNQFVRSLISNGEGILEQNGSKWIPGDKVRSVSEQPDK